MKIYNHPNLWLYLVQMDQGKSTLLKLISGELEPDGGEILLETTESNGRPLKSANTISILHPLYLDQDSGQDIVPSMTLAENLYLGLIPGYAGSLMFPWKKENRLAAFTALSKISMNLENRMHEQARILSGGEKQGLILARALLSDSSLLLFDEFVSALTSDLACKLISLTKNIIVEKKIYGLFVTHEIDLAVRFADALIFLHNGKILRELTENIGSSRSEIISLYSFCLNEKFNYG